MSLWSYSNNELAWLGCRHNQITLSDRSLTFFNQMTRCSLIPWIDNTYKFFGLISIFAFSFDLNYMQCSVETSNEKIDELISLGSRIDCIMHTSLFCSRGRATIAIGYTVDNKKRRTPCFSTLRLSRISPEPLKLQKIYLHFFMSVFKELSAGTEIFQIRWHNQLILAKMLIFQ